MTRNVARSTTLMLACYVSAAVFDYVFGAGASWFLTPEEYGALGVALSFFLLLGLFVASGFPTSLAKVLAEKDEASRGLVRYALVGNFVLSVAVAGLFLVLFAWGPLSPGPGYAPLLVIVAATVVFLSVGSTLQFALQGHMKFVDFGLLHMSKSLNKVLFGIPLALLGLGVAGALGGLLAGAIVLVVAAGAAYVVRARALPPGDEVTREDKRKFLRYTGAVFVGSLALTLLMSLDVLAVKYLTAPGASDRLAAYYQSAAILIKAPLWAVVAGMSVFFPMMSRASQRDPAAANRLVARVTRWVILALTPVVTVLTVFPDLALGLVFPPVYAAAAPALAAGAVGTGALAVCLVLTRALQATGRARAPGLFLGLTAAVQVALLVLLVPDGGARGAAVATSLACITGALLSGVAAVRAFGLAPTPAQVGKVAAAVGALIGVVALPDPVTRLGIFATLAAGTLAYAAVILALGLLPPDERRVLADRLPLGNGGGGRADAQAGDA